MTVIAGVAAHGHVTLGGDSAGVAGWDLRLHTDAKVFRRGPFVMGYTTSFRMGQLLRYTLQPPPRPPGMDAHEYMATAFVDAVRTCLKEGGWARKSDEQESGGQFLVGRWGRLFAVDNDYQVREAASGLDAVGCGDQVALGALWALGDEVPADERVRRALAAAERFSAGVRAPFVVVTTPE